MPFYEYECPHCRFYAEVLQKISDPPLKKCSSCGKAGFRRLISAPVFRLKGSGWYETDFKSDQEQKRNLVGSDAEPAAAEKAAEKAGEKAGEKADAKVEGGKNEAKTGSSAAAKPAPATAAKPAAKRAGKHKSRAAKPAARKPK